MMPMTCPIQKYILTTLLLLVCLHTQASHIAGGDAFYVYKGDSIGSGSIIYSKYEVTIIIYQDCQNGQPEAIAQDNPAYLAVYDGNHIRKRLDSIYYTSSTLIPVGTYPSSCGATNQTDVPFCLLKKTFLKNYALPQNTTGYVIAYQRCCRNAGTVNVANPGDMGVTYLCNIPAAPITNSSALFKNYAHQVACINMPLLSDASATDPDGDSLSYSFCAALTGANNADIKPIPLPPPYDVIGYIPPYSAKNPMGGSPAVSIDPVTGMITGTPQATGTFLVTVCCYEWRNGMLIDSVIREFEYTITNCAENTYKPSAGQDTVVFTGATVNFHAAVGNSFYWTPGTFLDDPSKPDPVGTFSVPGKFTYTLHAISDSGCNGTDERTIIVTDHSYIVVPNAFSPNGDGYNDLLYPRAVGNCTVLSFKVFNKFGNMLFSADSNSPSWNGSYKDHKQDMGVYIWQILYLDNNHTEQKISGNVTLLK